MNPKIEIIAVTYKQKHEMLCFVNSIINQTFNDWGMYLIHDGYSDDFNCYMNHDVYTCDNRINLIETPRRLGAWGHYSRSFGINNCLTDSDYTLITNADNYYVPVFFEEMINTAINNNSDIVYCNMLHDHKGYNNFESEFKRKFIDIGACLIKTSLVKAVGWRHICFHADWLFLEEIYNYIETELKHTPIINKVSKYLFVHN